MDASTASSSSSSSSPPLTPNVSTGESTVNNEPVTPLVQTGSQVKSAWTVTPRSLEEGTLVWEIDNFKDKYFGRANRFYLPAPSRLESPHFCANSDIRRPLTLSIELFHKWTRLEVAWTSVAVRIHQAPEKTPLTFRFNFSILNKDGEKANKAEGEAQIEEGGTYGIKKFLSMLDLTLKPAYYLPDDKLTIVLEVSLDRAPAHPSGFSQAAVDAKRQMRSEILRLLLPAPLYGDAILVSPTGHEHSVHRAILSTRSSTLETLFNLEEKSEQEKASCSSAGTLMQPRAVVDNISDVVFKEMLHFIYHGQVSGKEALTIELMDAAIKYQLPSLRKLVEYALAESLTTENVSNLLLDAEKYDAAHLKEMCIEFVSAHAPEVIETAGWKELATSKPELTMPVFIKQNTLLLRGNQSN